MWLRWLRNETSKWKRLCPESPSVRLFLLPSFLFYSSWSVQHLQKSQTGRWVLWALPSESSPGLFPAGQGRGQRGGAWGLRLGPSSLQVTVRPLRGCEKDCPLQAPKEQEYKFPHWFVNIPSPSGRILSWEEIIIFPIKIKEGAPPSPVLACALNSPSFRPPSYTPNSRKSTVTKFFLFLLRFNLVLPEEKGLLLISLNYPCPPDAHF